MLKRRIPKIVIAFMCISAMLMQYTGTLLAAVLSPETETAKLGIMLLYNGDEAGDWDTMSDAQKALYDQSKYVYFVGDKTGGTSTRLNKIVDESRSYENALYCLDASKAFPAETLTEYTNRGELSATARYNSNSLKWLMENVYLKYQQPEAKSTLLQKAFEGSSFDVNTVRGMLTDDDIDVVQQYAIWHFTNNTEAKYNEMGSIRVIPGTIGAPIDTDESNSKSFTDIDSKYAGRQDMMHHLFNYLVTTAESAPATRYPSIKDNTETRTVIENGFYVAGPFEIIQGDVSYDLKLKDSTTGNEITGYNLYSADKTTLLTRPMNKITEPFYIFLPTSVNVNNIKLTLSYDKFTTKSTLWQAEDDSKQPVVLINRTKATVTSEKPIVVVKKGTYNIEIVKQDKDSKEKLSGVEFNVQVGYGAEIPYTTNDEGIITIPNTPVTTVGKELIRITEKNAKDGYTKLEGTLEIEVTKAEESNQLIAKEIKIINPVDDMSASLNSGKITVTVDNTKVPDKTGRYEIELLKQDKDSKEKLRGAEFSVQIGEETATTYTTNDEGIITIPNIAITEVGTDDVIKIKETKAPTGYKAIAGTTEITAKKAEVDRKYVVNGITTKYGMKDTTASLNSGKISIVVDNEKEPEPEETPKYKLKVIKRDKDLNVNLDGADFSIQIGNNEPKMYTTNDNGVIEIPDIEIKSAGTDTIKLREINPPYGYMANDGEIELTITKRDVNGKYEITKVESARTTALIEDTYIEDQTVVIKICNKKIPYERPDDTKPTGKYEVVIEKIDKNGRTITVPATFDVNGETYTTINGTKKITEVEITKENLNEVDKYEIKETKSPKGYIKFDGTIEVDVLKSLTDDEGSYKAANANIIVRDSEGKQLHRGDKVKLTTNNGLTTVKISIVNYEQADLALRKFIGAISGTVTFKNTEYLESREPEVIIDDLDSGASTTAVYEHSKETVFVRKGNYILYTLRAYNEGRVDAYASQVVDYLPEGLEFVKTASQNSIWNYDEETRKLTTNDKYEAKLLKAHETGKELDYQDLQVVCKVQEDIEEDTNIVNIAEITEIKHQDGTILEDSDSTPNNIKYPENLPNYKGGNDRNPNDQYVPGQEDDDDFERIQVRSIKGYYDLEILKVDIKGNTIKDSSAKFDINGEKKQTSSGKIKIENIEINKHNVEEPDVYVITEEEAPTDYIKFNYPLRLEVSKMLLEDLEKYDVNNASMKILSGEIVDSDNFEVVREGGKTKVVVKVVNIPKADLALRKYIAAVSKDRTFESNEYLKEREPIVNLLNLDSGKSTTAKYNHEKTTVIVEKGNYILYTIRVYNEGRVNAYATEVTDYLPEGLEFVADATQNRIWDYDEETRKLTTNDNYDAKVIKAHEDGKELDYQDLQVVCKVSEEVKEDTDILNIAEITKINLEDGTTAEDRDSTPNNVNPENYNPDNGEDDDDYEKVLIKSIKGKYNLKIIKVDENGKIINTAVTKFKINDEEKETENGIIEISEIEINKNNVDTKDQYIITEETAPEGYEKCNQTIKVTVPKVFAEDGKSYVIQAPTLEIDGENANDNKNVTMKVKDGTIEIRVINKEIKAPEDPKKPEDPKQPDTPQNPDQPKQPDTPQPTPDTPKTTETPKKEIPSEKTPTPATGDMLPVIALGTIATIALLNIVQMIISKRKEN